MRCEPSGRSICRWYEGYNGDLKYAARRADGSWAVQTLDSAGDVGTYTSLAFAPGGGAAISYSDPTNKLLKYAQQIIIPEAEVPAPFQVIGITQDPVTKAVTLAWQGLPGTKYRVDFSPTMAAGTWLEGIGDNINALDGMTFFRTSGLLGQSNPRAFFRVLRK